MALPAPENVERSENVGENEQEVQPTPLFVEEASEEHDDSSRTRQQGSTICPMPHDASSTVAHEDVENVTSAQHRTSSLSGNVAVRFYY